MIKRICVFLTALCFIVPSAAQSQVKVGVILSLTGPAAALGIPEKKTIDILPKTAAGKSVEFIVLDDATDTTAAVKAAKKLTEEDRVDVIFGPSITPNSLAITDVAAASRTPVISLASSGQIVEPMDAKRTWMFKVPQGDDVEMDATVAQMVKAGVKTVGYIGYADAYGQGMERALVKATERNHVKIVAMERYSPKDTSVVAQILRITAAKPDVVLIGAAGTPAVLPQAILRQNNYKGTIYQTNGVTSNDFLRVGGKDVEGTLLLATPVLVAEQLPDANASKRPALEFLSRFEGTYGKGSRSNFAAVAWDAWKIFERAAPGALKKASPGTSEFRKALRDEIEQTHNMALNTGILTYSPTDHAGLDARDMVLVVIKNGKWKPIF
jgi:branched-chain amino acid transport system substrate-binding protein